MVTSDDPFWPSAASLLVSGEAPDGVVTLGVVGAHTFTTSVTARSALSTPAAIRAALARYSTWSFEDGVDLATRVALRDLGDIASPDDDDADWSRVRTGDAMTLIMGGDNAVTWRAMSELAGADLGRWGLVTLDAHLDLRQGRSNGSPVRQLLAQGLNGRRVVQIGLADFSNSGAYASAARDAGVTLISRSEWRRRGTAETIAAALEIAGAEGPIYVDVDVDVCDRAVVPGCPAAAPGGVSADDLRSAVHGLCADPRVRALDITEIDVARDTPDERTVRLGALLVLEAAAGVLRRSG